MVGLIGMKRQSIHKCYILGEVQEVKVIGRSGEVKDILLTVSVLQLLFSS